MSSNGWRVRLLDAWWVWAILAVGLILPSLIRLYLELMYGGYPFSVAIRHIASWQFAEGHNMFRIAIFGLIPFCTLIVILLCLSRKLKRDWFFLCAILGLLGILGYMIPAHVSVWRPLYIGTRTSSTAAIAFLFIPFYCLGTMGVGLAVAGLTTVVSILLTGHRGHRGS